MPGPARFPTTRWSMILRAGQPEESRSAFGDLCAIYWPPAYAFIRRQVREQEQAEDLTQAFFLRLLEKHDLPHARLERARFRSFLLASIQHFLSNEWDRARAQKRGGGQVPFSLDLEGERARWEPAHHLTPEKVFERRWCEMLLGRTLRALRQEYGAAGKAGLFEALKACLTGDGCLPAYRELAASLGISEGAVKADVLRLRRRYRDLLRAEIAETVEPEDVDDELRYLVTVMSQ